MNHATLAIRPLAPRCDPCQIARLIRGHAQNDIAGTAPGREFGGFEGLYRWSVEDLEGFWGDLWDFYGIRATPHDRVLAKGGGCDPVASPRSAAPLPDALSRARITPELDGLRNTRAPLDRSQPGA